MATVYSTRVWYGELLSTQGNTRIQAVPAGHRLVITDIHGQFMTTAGVYFSVLGPASGQTAVRVERVGTGAPINWSGRVVFHELENLYAQTDGNARVYISGWLLTGSGGPMTPTQLPSP